MLLAGVTVTLAVRLRHAGRSWRVTYAPLVVVSVAAGALLTAFVSARRIAPHAAAVDALGIAWALSFPAIAVAFLVGLVRGS